MKRLDRQIAQFSGIITHLSTQKPKRNSYNETICIEVDNISSYIEKWLRKQNNTKEESMTDWLLFEFSNKIPGVYYQIFTRWEEARKTGADWEWWFIFNDFSFAMTIQAKKLIPDSDCYPSIAYSNNHGMQIEKLLSYSNNNNLFPMYLYYSYDVKDVLCENLFNNGGIFLQSAQQVYNDIIMIGKRKVISTELIKNSNPLRCFFCCPIIYQNNFLEYIEHYFYINDKKENKKLGYHKSIPPYVSYLMGNRYSKDVFRREYSKQYENINSIMIVDFRNEQRIGEKYV